MQVAICDAERTGLAGYLRRHIMAAQGVVKSKLTELSIAIVDGRVMSRLHRDFLGIAGPTDVLTFELERDRRGNVTAGEIVICAPFGRKQAKLRRVPFRQEMLLYALHGMLHLCGYDDRTRSGFQRMHQTEDMILQQLGVGAVFAAGNRPAKVSYR